MENLTRTSLKQMSWDCIVYIKTKRLGLLIKSTKHLISMYYEEIQITYLFSLVIYSLPISNVRLVFKNKYHGWFYLLFHAEWHFVHKTCESFNHKSLFHSILYKKSSFYRLIKTVAPIKRIYTSDTSWI